MSEDRIVIRPESPNRVRIRDERVEQLESATIQTDFEADKTQIVQGESVQFTDLSTLSPTEWHWDFGDGTYSTEQHPTKTYYKPGTHTVKLVASGQGGSEGEAGNTEEKVGFVQVDGVLDGLSIAGVWGFFLVSKNYTGPLVRLRRESDDAEVDVHPNAFGRVSYDSFVDSSGDGVPDTPYQEWADGSELRAVTLYDLFGNSDHATESSASDQMPFAIGDVNGLPGWNPIGDETYPISNTLLTRSAHSLVKLSENKGANYLGTFANPNVSNSSYLTIRSNGELLYRPNNGVSAGSYSGAEDFNTCLFHFRKHGTDGDYRLNGESKAFIPADVPLGIIGRVIGLARGFGHDSLAFYLPNDRMTDSEEAALVDYVKKLTTFG